MNLTWDITVGNIITIIGGIIATAMLWQRMSDRIETTEKQTEKNTAELDSMSKLALSTTVQQHERRVQELERIGAGVGAMQADISWIKGQLGQLLNERLTK